MHSGVCEGSCSRLSKGCRAEFKFGDAEKKNNDANAKGRNEKNENGQDEKTSGAGE